MNVLRSALALFACAAVVVGCGDDDAPPARLRGGTVAAFELPASGPIDWGAVPFPSDLYLDERGEVAIGELPTPASQDPLYLAVRETLRKRGGFCATCNVHFRIEGGGLDAATLPPAGAMMPSPSDSLILADVDERSPERGRLFPLRIQWRPADGLLAVRPVRGIALHGGRRYAAALTSALLGSDGLPVEPTDAFVALRDATGARALPAIERALVELDRAGVARERVIALAPFTTEDPTADLVAAREAVHAAPRPTAEIDRVYEGEAIDDLLGVPGSDRPGIDVEPAAGTEGTRSIRHGTVRLIVTGRFRAPRLVEGDGFEVGVTRRDDAGRVMAGPQEDVPFVLIVPSGVDLARLPVTISQHGFNASRTTGFVLADTAGRAGSAVLAIDAYQHGARAPSSQDAVHAMRGDGVAGEDGFAETSVTDVSARVFGIAGVPADRVLFAGYALGAFTQFAADVMAAVRFVRDGDAAAIRAAHPDLATLAFDRDRVMYVGNSLGAVIGTSVLVAERDIAAAVLDVAPGSIVETLSESPEFRPLSTTVLLPALGIEGRFDEVERAIVMDPIVDLFRWVIEPIEPFALARHVVAERVTPGPAPDVLWQLAGLDEVAAPSASESMVEAAGVTRDATFDGAVAAVRRFDPAGHGMLELSEQASRYEPPVVPPFTERAEPLVVLNPIEAVHAQIEELLRSRIATGRARITDDGS